VLHQFEYLHFVEGEERDESMQSTRYREGVVRNTLTLAYFSLLRLVNDEYCYETSKVAMEDV
jgi:hypothetical protein